VKWGIAARAGPHRGWDTLNSCFLAAAPGLALGAALSVLLIYVVNKQSFGRTIRFHPPSQLPGALAAAARLDPIDVIHEE